MAETMEQFCFVNNYTHAIDAQRRIAIPSEWRKKDGETSFYLLPAKEHIVQLIPKETFYEQVIRKAQKMSLADARQLRDLADTTEDISFAVGSTYCTGEYDICLAMQEADGKMYKDKEDYYRLHPEKDRRKRSRG